ncbi:DUF4198 domain-containing protein [Sphingomonas sanxanigenens]|uniref:NAD+ synthetase n=1 Tax=Sphingomonas sanxanigenens DSM 19645 = NX02 TaxID=1123269 RepID=W0ACF9_9SPHN|nr:DUF4198 domain-containing protein [Sphingomonas sanxanigenens]AHE53370.1 hypothetical protein NX02_08230 [Sphingomonas sanxanigenens DSM 19645 = NX02]
MRFRSWAAVGTAAALLIGAGAQAHMPYLLPTAFDVGRADHVTLQSSFGEDAFVPEVAMRDAPFHLVGPDGRKGSVGPATYLRDLSIFEADLKTEGTYRLTTGQRLGRKGKMFEANGQWLMRGEDGNPPVGAREVDVQSTTRAEAFVTRGQATRGALKPVGTALEIEPITHPAEIASGTDARFRLLFDGKPLAGTRITMFRAAGNYDGQKVAAQIDSGADGSFALRPRDAGLYLILVRHRTTAPAGSETPYRSYTYTLAFDAA